MRGERAVLRLIRGEIRGPFGALGRAGLRAASLGFSAGARLRGVAYDRGMLGARHPGVPVISVGNLTTGGTGKTPLVGWLADRLHARGLVVGVLSRGYGAKAGELGDELVELTEAREWLVAEQDPDRLAGAVRAIARGAQVLVLDDGFQHRRIARDVDLVAVSARDPFGGGALLPRGLLREPPKALRRAHGAVITRSDQVDGEALAALESRLSKLAPGIRIWRARHAPVGVVVDGARHPVEWLRGRHVFAFSGLGDPGAFERTLVDCGAVLDGTRRFPDHHVFGAAELAALPAGIRITTRKDAARLPAGFDAVVLEVALEIDGGESLDDHLLEPAVSEVTT